MKLDEVLAPVSSELEAVELRLRNWADTCGDIGRSEFTEVSWTGDLPVISEVVGRVIRSGGKRLRPACFLLANGLGGHTGESEKAIEFAATIEVIHTASLVHDDIVDGAPVRRGAATVHARHGQPVALLVGDLLYSRLFRQLTLNGWEEALRCVAETVHRMVLGELAETLRRDDLSLTEPGYLEVAANKTGALFSCATFLGAREGRLSEEDALKLRQYGECLGAAFQIVDDLLDVCEEETDLGKPVGADLCEGKVTLPVIHALDRSHGFERQEISRLFSVRDAGGLRAALRRTGSLSHALAKAEDAVAEAQSCLEGFSDGPSLRALVGLGEYVASRGREALLSITMSEPDVSVVPSQAEYAADVG